MSESKSMMTQWKDWRLDPDTTLKREGSLPTTVKQVNSPKLKKAKDEPKDEPSDTVDAYEIMDNPDYVLTVLDEFEDEGMDVDDIRDRVDAMKDLDGEEYEDEAFALADELKDMKKAL